jgi:hypothetical protein
MPDRNNYSSFQQLLSQILAHNLQNQQMQQQARPTNPMLDTLLSSHYGNQGTPLPFGNRPINGPQFSGQYGLSPAFLQLMNAFRQGRMAAPGGGQMEQGMGGMGGMGMGQGMGAMPGRQAMQTQRARGVQRY